MLGQRLKEARIEAGLSQRQLCGEVITRNMLSQIESGKARPSMQTLTYLAQALDKPVSWFLEEQPAEAPADELLEKARESFRAEKYQDCLEKLEQLESGDEVSLLRTMSQLKLARQAVEESRHHYARSLLEKAAQNGSQTAYYTESMERERLLLLSECQPEQAAALEKLLPADYRELYLRAEGRLAAGDFGRCVCLLQAIPEQTARWHSLMGQALMGQQEYARAAESFLQAEEQYPALCAAALETCYRELEDYKKAYQYACKQRM